MLTKAMQKPEAGAFKKVSEAARASAEFTSCDKVWPWENNARIMVEDIAQRLFTENLYKGTHTARTKTHQQFHWKSSYNRHHAGRWSLKAELLFIFKRAEVNKPTWC